MQVAFLQVASPDDEGSGPRAERVLDAITDAGRGADLVLLPELWAPGYFAFDRYEEEAAALDSPLVEALRAAARGADCTVFAGSVLERSDLGIHNTALLIDRSGAVVLTYRKCHLFGLASSREAQLLVPGDRADVVDTDLGRVGLMTCYDLRFPELARELLDQGASVILTAAAWPQARLEHWRLLVRARALENQVFLLACNGAGATGGVTLAGHSVVVDPRGEVLLELGPEPDAGTATIDLADVERTRAEFPVLADRRRTFAAASVGELR